MLIVVFDVPFTLKCILFAFFVELLRIVLAHVAARPSNKIRQLQLEKLETNLAVAAIKSVQLEFVKHSKLTRKVIKLSQEIDALLAENAPKFKRVKNYFRVIRVVVYLAFIVYFWGTNFAAFSPKILWPFNIFVSKETGSLPVWVLVVLSGFFARHTWRTMVPFVARHLELP